MGFFSRLFGKNKNTGNPSKTVSNAKATDTKEVIEGNTKENNSALKNTNPQPKETKKAEVPQKTEAVAKTEAPKKDTAPNKEQVTKNLDAQEKAEAAPSVTEKSKTQSGFFEIKKSKDNRYVFNLYASNRVIIATSQIYSSSQSAINGANSVIANAEKASIEDQTQKDFTVMPYPKWEIYKDKADEFRFRLSASNGSCICHSQGYTNKANCKNGIESIIRTVKNAKIEKAYVNT